LAWLSSGMIKWDLKTQSCCFYDIIESKSCLGVKAVYNGLGVAKDEVEVEQGISRDSIGTWQNPGRTG
jgi:hypothetical protein